MSLKHLRIKHVGRAAASAVLASLVAVTAIAPATADVTVTIDPTVTGQSVVSNGVPTALPTGAESITVKLPADAAGVVGKSVTGLNYFFYNEEGTPIPGLNGYVSVDAAAMEVTVAVPAELRSYRPGTLPHCYSYPSDCANDPTATTFTGYRLTLFSIESSGTPYLPLFMTAGLVPNSDTATSAVTVDLTAPDAVTSVYSVTKAQSAALAHLTDKLVLRAPSGYFTTGPSGDWTDVSAQANYYPTTGNVYARGQTKVSQDGDTAVVTMHPADLAVLCSQPLAYDLGLQVNGAAPAGYAAAATAISLGSPVCAQSFTDVAPSLQFFPEIQWLADQKITTGYGNGLYGPFGTVNRDAMAAFMYRMAGSPEFTAPAVSPFADITPSTQFYKEITWLAERGISTGWLEADGTRTYRPLSPVNRDAMAAFLYRFSGSPALPDSLRSPFVDVPTGAQFWKEISWLAEQQISTGYPDQTFRPLDSIRRDAMAAFLSRTHTWQILK